MKKVRGKCFKEIHALKINLASLRIILLEQNDLYTHIENKEVIVKKVVQLSFLSNY